MVWVIWDFGSILGFVPGATEFRDEKFGTVAGTWSSENRNKFPIRAQPVTRFGRFTPDSTGWSLTKSEILTPGNPNGLAKPPDQPISFDSLACENGGRRNSDCLRSCLRHIGYTGTVLGCRHTFVPVVLPLSSAAVAQLVEHNVANVVVVGSNPISRSSQAFPHFQGCELDVHVRNH